MSKKKKRSGINPAFVALADRGPILKSTTKLGKKALSQWLANNSSPSCTLPSGWAAVNLLPASDVVDVLAAATPNHCVDGWSYAARAVSAFLAGDLHASRHLAYYAQLRAALCMLGCLGVGVFNGINFAVDSSGKIVRIDPSKNAPNKGFGTHRAVWGTLDLWVKNSAKARQFLEMIKVTNVSLETCLDAIWPGASPIAVAEPLIDGWGLDLKRGSDEHLARNMSSYNPQAFQAMTDRFDERLEFVQQIWKLFEPTSSYRFDLLDKHLLRQFLWKQHDLLHQGMPKNRGPIHTRWDNLPVAVQKIAPQDFLTGVIEPDVPQPLVLARSNSLPAEPVHMISRALLLLRAATGFAITNFNDANIKVASGDLRPWIDPLAAAKGFWPPAAPLQNPTDLWEDVQLGLDELTFSMNPPLTSFHDWLQRKPAGLPVLSEADRIGIWSFSP